MQHLVERVEVALGDCERKFWAPEPNGEVCLLDFGLICACLIAAFLLRFEGNLDAYSARSLEVIFPYVVACQMVAFYASGLYHGLWRYMTVSDIGPATRGVVFGTLAAFVLAMLMEPPKLVPRAALVIDAALLLLAVVGVRLGLKALRFHFALRWREGWRRVRHRGGG